MEGQTSELQSNMILLLTLCYCSHHWNLWVEKVCTWRVQNKYFWGLRGYELRPQWRFWLAVLRLLIWWKKPLLLQLGGTWIDGIISQSQSMFLNRSVNQHFIFSDDATMILIGVRKGKYGLFSFFPMVLWKYWHSLEMAMEIKKVFII